MKTQKKTPSELSVKMPPVDASKCKYGTRGTTSQKTYQPGRTAFTDYDSWND